MEILKEVRYLPGATPCREKKHIVKIVKNASKNYGIDVVVHICTNDLCKKMCFLCRKISRSLVAG